MTRSSIGEYIDAQRPHYRRCSRAAKGRLLSEMRRVTGLHRKSLIRALNRSSREDGGRRPGRPRRYGAEVARAAEVVWQASGQISSRRLRPFVAYLVGLLRKHGEVAFSAEVEARLCQASATTLDRLLREPRRLRPRRRRWGPRPASLLQKEVPVRTFAEWKGEQPGALQVDLVSHGGTDPSGFYLWTLTAVDVASGWLELEPLWGRDQQVVLAAVHALRRRLPVPLRSLDSDNGSEFINRRLVDYCRAEGIALTRGRPGKKNDGAYVEQKNGAIVRQLVGHSRFSSRSAYEQLGALYALVRLQVNLFQPGQKTLTRIWSPGGRQRRVYDEPLTPFQRLCAAGVINEESRQALERELAELNPLALSRQINTEVERLKSLRERPRSRPSVTVITGEGINDG